MHGLEIPNCRDQPEFEWLLWVGCARSTYPSATKTKKAVAELLKKASVNFGCLGWEEPCTGDPRDGLARSFLSKKWRPKTF